MSATPIADAIRAIEDRIGDERYWTQAAFHRVIPASGGATAACLAGAAFDESANFLLPFLTEMSQAWDFDLPTFLNDNSTHADVMLFLATALDVAEAEGL